MKLSAKIFLGIIIPTIVVVSIVSYILINKSFNSNLESQVNIYTSELDNLNISIENTIDRNNNYDYKDVLQLIGEYYNKNQKYILLYNNGELVYRNNNKFEEVNNKMLDVDDENYNSIINKKNNKYYSYLSLKVNDNQVLIYIRDITNIYLEKNNMIRLCIILTSMMIILIMLVAFIISKTLTKPLFKMKKEMSKLSQGNFDISLKEGKDEIGLLSHDFNIMSKELQKRNSELLEMIDSKQLFIDNLSHEMNTPLTSIYGYSKLLENAELSVEQRIKYLQYIQSETDRISEMYKKLLTISYKENNNVIKNEVNLSELLNSLKEELKNKLDKKNLELIIDNNVDNIYADNMLLSLAISNLVRNASEISDNNKKIIIKTYEDESNRYISVIDEGKGIEEEQISKIVEPFYRVDKARSRAHGGAGLGLSIVTRVMELHNGKLDIKSKIGEGSTFTLIFPK